MVHLRELRVFAVEQGAARHDPRPGGFAAGDQAARGFALDDHGADKNRVRPIQVATGEPADAFVHQPQRPRGRQQGGDGQQPQRRMRRPFADKFQRVLEAPEGVGEFRADQ